VGSRTPVSGTPAWVTLEVAHGGFASGQLVAETPLRADELALLGGPARELPGATDRERINLWYLWPPGPGRSRAAHHRTVPGAPSSGARVGADA
jgi:hypothetical protein